MSEAEETKPAPAGKGRAASFFGRTSAIERVRMAIQHGERLITISGLGGIGKTRLAKHILDLMRDERDPLADSIVECQCEGAATLGDFFDTVAMAIGGVRGGATIESIGKELGARGPMLVLVDNFESVASVAADAIGTWLTTSPDTRFLVTSREHLGVANETHVALGPLDEDSATALFVEHARRRFPAAVVDPDELRIARNIVKLLDGIPLAIEIVAAKVGVVALAELHTRLGDALDLSTPQRAPADRHRTLRASIEWSHQGLDEREQHALALLSVFVGGFDMRAAEAILDRSGLAALELVERLASKSFLVRESAHADGPVRLRCLVPVRTFAMEQLARRNESRTTAVRHAEYYLRLASEIGREVESQNAGGAIAKFASDTENFIAARACLMEEGRRDDALTLACDLTQAWTYEGPAAVLLRWLRDAVEHASTPATRARVGACLALAVRIGTGEIEALELAERALAIAREIGDARLEAFALAEIASTLSAHDRPEEARERTLEAEAVARNAGADFYELHSLLRHAVAALTDRQFDEARRVLSRARVVRGEVDLGLRSPSFHVVAAELAAASGDSQGMLEECERAVEASRCLRSRRLEASMLYFLALSHRERGAHEEAIRLLTASRAIFRQLGGYAELDVACQLGALQAFAGNARRAISTLQDAAARAAKFGLPRLELEARAGEAVVYALSNDVPSARSALEESRKYAKGSKRGQTIIMLAEGCIDIIEGDALVRSGRRTEGLACLDRGRERIATEVALSGERFVDTGIWSFRMSALAVLGRYGMSTEVGADRVRLRIGRRIEFFAVGSGEPVDLSSRGLLRRLVARLAKLATERPGEVASADELVEVGWPQATVVDRAALARLYTAITSLRRLGIGDLIESTMGGYRFKPNVDVEFV